MLRAHNYATPNVDLECPQGRRLDATYFDDVSFSGTKVSCTSYQPLGFDWGNGSPGPYIGPYAFSAGWAGQGEAPTSGVYTFTTAADDGVWLFVGGKQLVEIDASGETDGFLRRELGLCRPRVLGRFR